MNIFEYLNFEPIVCLFFFEELIFLSQNNSQKLSYAIAHLGLRETDKFSNIFNEIQNDLKRLEFLRGELNFKEDSDDYIVFFSLLSLLQKFFVGYDKMNSEQLSSAISLANKFYADLSKYDIQPWIEIFSHLNLELIRIIQERSIINLNISEKMKHSLSNYKMRELWIPQIRAVNQGLLEGKSILYSSPTGTGKSFLAYLSLGKLVSGKQIVYLVPTKSLSTQVSEDVKKTMRTPKGSSIYISIEDPIGLVKVDSSEGVEPTKKYKVEQSVSWKQIISFINKYFNFLLTFDENGIQSVGSEGNDDTTAIKAQLQASISAFGETCDIKPVAESDPSFLTKLKNFCKFKKVSTRGEHELIECEGK